MGAKQPKRRRQLRPMTIADIRAREDELQKERAKAKAKKSGSDDYVFEKHDQSEEDDTTDDEESEEEADGTPNIIDGEELPDGRGDRINEDTGEFETFDVDVIPDDELERLVREDERFQKRRELSRKKHERLMDALCFNYEHEANYGDDDINPRTLLPHDDGGRYALRPDPEGDILERPDGDFEDAQGNRIERYGAVKVFQGTTEWPLGIFRGKGGEKPKRKRH